MVRRILEHYNYRGQVMRVLFTAQDSQTIRDAFGRAKPNAEYARLYAAAVARRQSDQIYNLSLTRTATVILGKGARGVIGVGRVKTPTLAIVCKRELEIRDFVPLTYFEVVATAKWWAANSKCGTRHKIRILRREIAENVVNAAQGFEGPLSVGVEDKRQGPPKLHDLPSLQKLCASRFGWVGCQDAGSGAGTRMTGRARRSSPIPAPRCATCRRVSYRMCRRSWPDFRWDNRSAQSPCRRRLLSARARTAVSTTRDSEGASHHAVIPNVNTVDSLREVWPRLSIDEKKLFDVIARAYLAAVMPDFRYRQTTATLDVGGFPFKATGRQPIDLGWRAAFPEWQPADEKGDDAQLLPAIRNGETAQLQNPESRRQRNASPAALQRRHTDRGDAERLAFR